MTTKLDCGHAATPQGCAAGYARDNDAALLGLATRREDSDESEDPWITLLAWGKRK